MGSLEQQMALFEELISQEQAPTNGILVPRNATLVSMAQNQAFGVRSAPVVTLAASGFTVHQTPAVSLQQQHGFTVRQTPVVVASRAQPSEILTSLVRLF